MLKELLKKYEKMLASKGVKLKFSDEEKMISAKLKDGGEIKTTAESWNVGVPVLDADGNPAADGEYVLEDGTVVTVAGGALAEIEAPSSEEEMSAEDAVEVLKIAAEQKETIEALSNENETLKNEATQMKSEKELMSKEIADLKAKVEKLSKLPAEKSTKFKREEAHADKPKSRVDAILKAMHEAK